MFILLLLLLLLILLLFIIIIIITNIYYYLFYFIYIPILFARINPLAWVVYWSCMRGPSRRRQANYPPAKTEILFHPHIVQL